jgi:hypothetical protein
MFLLCVNAETLTIRRRQAGVSHTRKTLCSSGDTVLSIGHEDDDHDDARTISTGTNLVYVRSSPSSLSPKTWNPAGPDLNMTTDDTNKRSDSRDLRGNLGDDHGRLTGGHPKSTVDQQRDASVQKDDIEARPISQSSEPQTSKKKARPPSPGKRFFKGKFFLSRALWPYHEPNNLFTGVIAQSHTSSTSFSSSSNSNSNSYHSSDPYSGAGADDFDPITGTYGRKIRLGGDDEDRVCILQ